MKKPKLRLTNGAYFFLAISGLICGYQYVHEAMADVHIRAEVSRLMHEDALATSTY